MFRALSHPTYRLLFGSQIASLLGSGLLTVALSLQAYALDPARASFALGLIFTVKITAFVGCSPFVKAAVAPLAPKRVLVGADLIRVAIATAFPFVHNLGSLVAALFVLQLASAVYTPTYQSLLPKVLDDKQDYTGALSLARIAEDLEAIASPLIAAALLAVMNSSELHFGTAAGFALSAALVTACHLPLRSAAGCESNATFVARSLAGVRLAVTHPRLRPLLGLGLAEALLWSYILVDTVVLVRRDLSLGEDMVAIVLACFGGGSILSACFVPSALRRFPPHTYMLADMVAAVAAMAAIAVAVGGAPVDVGTHTVTIGVLWARGWALPPPLSGGSSAMRSRPNSLTTPSPGSSSPHMPGGFSPTPLRDTWAQAASASPPGSLRVGQHLPQQGPRYCGTKVPKPRQP